MKKIFTSRSLKLFITAVALTVSTSSFANDTKWHYFYDEFHAYPAGSGLIYVSEDSKLDPATLTDEDWNESAEMSKPVYQGSGYHDYYIYTKSINGTLPLAVCEGTRVDELSDWNPSLNANGNYILYNQETPLRYTAKTTNEAPDEESCIAGAPVLPERCTYALFTYVAPRIYDGGKNMGTVTNSKDVNSIGDVISLTANPKDARCHFDYWIQKSNGNKISDNPLNVQVTGADEYYAHFSCDSAVVINFPAEGGYYVWYSNIYYSAESSNFKLIRFDTGKYSEKETADETRYAYCEKQEFLSSSYGAWNGAPVLLYGKGEATLLKNDALSAYSDITSTSATRWSGEGINIADLPVANSYYNVDLENEAFTLVPESQTTIAAKTMYLAIPKASFLYGDNAPTTIYWSEAAAAEATGISEAEISKNSDNSKMYNVNGMEIKSIGKGIYIMNGKKVINN